MTIVYLDTYIFVNFVLNYLLLLASGKLVGERVHFWRITIASSLGALYAICTFFSKTQFAMHPAIKISVALLMVLIVFGHSSKLLRITVVFFAIACAFCGVILAIEFLKGGSYTQDGVLYSSVDMKALLISAGLCYGILTLFFKRSALHNTKSNELVDVTFHQDDQNIKITALHDTGNTLQDSITGQQIMVVEGEKIISIFPQTLDLSMLSNPIECMEHISKNVKNMKFRLFPYRAVGVDCGILLGVRIDKITVQNKEHKNHYIALSPTPVSDGGSYHALIGADYIK